MNDNKTSFIGNENNQIDGLIAESHSMLVRLERRNLLIVSSIIFISVAVGLNPENFSIFGFSFKKLSEENFYFVLAALDIYFLFAFFIYSKPSYRLAKANRDLMLKNGMTVVFQDESILNSWKRRLRYSGGTFRYRSWIFFHFNIPKILRFIALLLISIKIIY